MKQRGSTAAGTPDEQDQFRYWSFGLPTLRAGPQFRISDFY